ncbi:predicted protein [Methanosarcina acetivorans C2A]|uniref:Uncharacterized protein n=1 Tax=Methanosarcina acetivorans (strain ATCC 35395 / DSM 2834 / JCM 12185 / C2A) TaxID=188937 RepID=Q8TQ78_METAC|nr:predicted protein [Methanosarcina acetivorans C2A]
MRFQGLKGVINLQGAIFVLAFINREGSGKFSKRDRKGRCISFRSSGERSTGSNKIAEIRKCKETQKTRSK